jgi:hypothetical protein
MGARGLAAGASPSLQLIKLGLNPPMDVELLIVSDARAAVAAGFTGGEHAAVTPVDARGGLAPLNESEN